ncbi:MAG: hypothetical protein JRN68_08850 [Nitrososphaerota archaeon]|nr:hypothetical protein [Nitrososphaerota archaeon]
MQITVDEWLVEYLSPASEASKVEQAHAFTERVKRKCDKMVFTSEHLRRFRSRSERFRREVNDAYYFPLVLRPLTLLLYNSDKVQLCAAAKLPDNAQIPEDDVPIVQSLMLCESKTLITTDERLVQAIKRELAQHEVKCVTPKEYIDDAR